MRLTKRLKSYKSLLKKAPGS